MQRGKLYMHKKIECGPKSDDSNKNDLYRIVVIPCVFDTKISDDIYQRVCTVTQVFRGAKKISVIHRNSSVFPFTWCMNHPDGHDYLVSGEDYQGQTVIQLDTGRRVDYIEEDAKEGLSFSWSNYWVDSTKSVIAVEGVVKTRKDDIMDYQEMRFYDFTSPMEMPYLEIGERLTSYYDECHGWSDDGYITVVNFEECRKKDGVRVSSLDRKERIKCFKKPGLVAQKKVIYNHSIDGVTHIPVYSEWI